MQNRNIQHLDCEFNRKPPFTLFLCQRIVHRRDTEDAEFRRESLCISGRSVSLWLGRVVKLKDKSPGVPFRRSREGGNLDRLERDSCLRRNDGA